MTARLRGSGRPGRDRAPGTPRSGTAGLRLVIIPARPVVSAGREVVDCLVCRGGLRAGTASRRPTTRGRPEEERWTMSGLGPAELSGVERIRPAWMWFVAMGGVLVALGVVALGYPFLTTVVGVYAFGWMLI